MYKRQIPLAYRSAESLPIFLHSTELSRRIPQRRGHGWVRTSPTPGMRQKNVIKSYHCKFKVFKIVYCIILKAFYLFVMSKYVYRYCCCTSISQSWTKPEINFKSAQFSSRLIIKLFLKFYLSTVFYRFVSTLSLTLFTLSKSAFMYMYSSAQHLMNICECEYLSPIPLILQHSFKSFVNSV